MRKNSDEKASIPSQNTILSQIGCETLRIGFKINKSVLLKDILHVFSIDMGDYTAEICIEIQIRVTVNEHLDNVC